MSRDYNEDTDNVQRCLGSAGAHNTEAGMLHTRVEEQAALICVLKRRADEALVRCQALQKVNAELEGQVVDGQKEVDTERSKAVVMEKRFNDLATNLHGLMVFKEEYKRHNVQLLEENKLLRAKNETLFSQKLQDKETLIRQLQQDIHLSEERHKAIGNDFKEKEAELQSKLLKLKSLQQSQEAELLKSLQDSQRSLKEAEEMCKELRQKLQQAGDEHVLKETKMNGKIKALSGEKDKVIKLAIERGKAIQAKQERLQQLEIKLKEAEEANTRAENRFKQEAEAVNVNAKVTALQRELNEAARKAEKGRVKFEAYKEHTAHLLAQEKELNAKLRHMFA